MSWNDIDNEKFEFNKVTSGGNKWNLLLDLRMIMYILTPWNLNHSIQSKVIVCSCKSGSTIYVETRNISLNFYTDVLHFLLLWKKQGLLYRMGIFLNCILKWKVKIQLSLEYFFLFIQPYFYSSKRLNFYYLCNTQIYLRTCI